MRWNMWAAVAVAVVAVGTVEAQQRQRPGTGTGGRGGFQQPLEMLVLSNEALQAELKITDDQKGSLKDVMAKAADLAKARTEAFSGGQFDREKMQELQTASTKLTEEAKTAVDKALTAEQKTRLKQIDVQRMGFAAFANEEVVKAMKLTDEQTEAMKKLGEEMQTARRQLATEYGLGGRPGGAPGGARPDPEKMAEYNKKMAEMTKETMESAAKQLTDDQKKTWAELTGKEFDVSKLTPARPMRRDN